MKNKFFEYFPKSNNELTKLWNKAIFAVDANVLLNLYRYSEETKNKLLEALNAQKEKIFLPYQAGEEFFRNCSTTIAGQAKEYANAIKELDDVEKKLTELKVKLGEKTRHPFASTENLDKAFPHLKNLKEELAVTKNTLNPQLTGSLLEHILLIFDDRVGKPLQEDPHFEANAKKRFDNEVPPGYMDSKKGVDRSYGDLIVWKQIIEHARVEETPLIFITDDRKDDWWLRVAGKTISPRPELIKEFKAEAKQDFWMCSVAQFLKLHDENVKPEIIEEVRGLNEDSKSVNEILYFWNNIDNFNNHKELINITGQNKKIMDAMNWYKEWKNIASFIKKTDEDGEEE